MTDLHCHILPGMDDGAKDTAVSLELLRREYEDGVRNIAFTSHLTASVPQWKPLRQSGRLPLNS